ncbi:MAG: hypothetical protein ABSG04_09610 [Verrucomicrobiota bacterium]|jgi:FtsH-binding integral membrane protein
MNSLQSQKQLLLAESELNRAQLAGDMAALTADVRALAGRAKTIGLIASSATALLVGLAAFRRKKSASAGGKPSWLPTILEGAGLVSSLWLAFRPQPRNRDGG